MPTRRRKGERTANEDLPPGRESETLNAGALATDQEVHRERVACVAGTVAHLAGLPNPEADAKKVTCRSSPMSSSTARARPPRSNRWRNGRALDDDSVDIAVAFLAEAPLGGAVVPPPPSPRFLTCRRPSPRTCQP
jgi:hypothetical protein